MTGAGFSPIGWCVGRTGKPLSRADWYASTVE
jgi:hypothetical protein